MRINGLKKLLSYRILDYDFYLAGMVIALSIVGVMAISSVEPGSEKKQVMGIIIGVVFMLIISLIDYAFVIKFGWLYYLGAVGVLALVFTGLGHTSHNARRWLDLPGIRFQPAELTKILLILFFAQFIMKYREHVKSLLFVLICLLLAALPLALIYKQPDLSTTIMLTVIISIILFVAGIDWKIVTTVLVVLVPTVILVIYRVLQGDSSILKPYQEKRILSWLHPEDYAMDDAFQTLNSIMAIGSGQLYGKGYNTNEISTVMSGGYVSESESDFIFTVIGEEFGFVGSCIVVMLILLIAVECMVVASRARDIAGRVVAAGVGAWIGFQGLMNIGVATGVMINTGLPLPFVSSGLTSLVSCFAGIGFVLNVKLQSRKL